MVDAPQFDMQVTKSEVLKDLARKAFQACSYQDALDLYLEALKHAAANNAPEPPCAAAAAAAAAAEQPATRGSGSTEQQLANGDELALKSSACAPVTPVMHQHPSAPAATAAAAAVPPDFAVLCSNIAAVLLKLHRPQEALEYAAAAAQAAPDWPKALYRHACVLLELQQHHQAAQLLKQLTQQMTPGTPEAESIQVKLCEAESVVSRTQHHLAVQSAMMATHTAWATTQAKEASGRASLLSQLQQGMAGPAWEPQDWEWRPTWTPSMRRGANSLPTNSSNNRAACKETQPTASSSEVLQTGCEVTGPSPGDDLLANCLSAAFESPEQQQQYLQLLAELTHRLAELEGPQRGYQLLQDSTLLLWYKQELAEAVAAKRAAGVDGPCVLVVANGGGGLLGMLAAAAGAGRVFVVEKGRWGFRAARQLIEGNRQQQPGLVSKVELVPVPLGSCYIRLQQQDQQQHNNALDAVDDKSYGKDDAAMPGGSSSSSSSADREEADALVKVVEADTAASVGAGHQDHLGYQLQQQADILVTDMFDYSVVGQGLLTMLQTAAAARLLSPTALLLPSQVNALGQLVDTHMRCSAAGFDVMDVNKYKWHPTIEKISHDRLQQFKASSEPFRLLSLSLSAHAGSLPISRIEGSPTHQRRSSDSKNTGTATAAVDVQLTGDADACVIWCELVGVNTSHVISTGTCAATSLRGVGTGSSTAPCGCGGSGTVTHHATCRGQGLFYLDDPLVFNNAPSTASGCQQQQQQIVAITADILHHLRLDIVAGALGRTRCRESSTLSQASSAGAGLSLRGYTWSPHGTPRHAYLPRWHFNMLADEVRNTAYAKAIRREVKRLQTRAEGDQKLLCAEQVHVLDIGTGTGLLAMMAARAGADTITAVESVRHLAETATSIVSLNGLNRTINVIHKDGRYLTVGGQQATADLSTPADLLAFEVFDCGLIGEGALHIVAAAKSSLLRPGASILPATAKVYCQPIQYCRHTPSVLADVVDTTPMYCYGWSPDYFEADLAAAANLDAVAPPSAAPAGTFHTASPAWKGLAAPQLVFRFDFNTPNPLEEFKPAARNLEFVVEQPGVLNAVAFWFELQLDEATQLSTNPYANRQPNQPSTTWKQAVQLLQEREAVAGQMLKLTANHDTYSVRFMVDNSISCTPTTSDSSGSTSGTSVRGSSSSSRLMQQSSRNTTPPAATGVPLYDPAWKTAYDNISQLQGHLTKAVTQDPLEYRRMVTAALLLAMRPWGKTAVLTAADGITQPTPISNGADDNYQTLPVADPHHAAAMLVSLMT